jgi:nucleoside-diphosphate-sugar epimerase
MLDAVSRILVTGGAGYIGSVLVPMLLEAGHEVVVVDDFRFGQSSLLGVAHHQGFCFHRGDARDRGLLAPLVATSQVLIPLAAVVGAPACDRDPEEATAVNLEAVRMLDELRGSEKTVLFPNTNSGYGVGGEAPCTEDDELRPISHYGRTKVAAERLLLASGNCVVFRLATVFGASPRMRFDLMVNDFVRQAVTVGRLELYEPEFRRNFIHVRDVAHTFLFALDNADRMRDRVFNVGLSSANLSKRQLAERIARHVQPLEIVEAATGSDPDRRDYLVSNRRLEALGWRPRHDLDHGIRELITTVSMVPGASARG